MKLTQYQREQISRLEQSRQKLLQAKDLFVSVTCKDQETVNKMDDLIEDLELMINEIWNQGSTEQVDSKE
jgi:Tfp pilus assembly protein PilN